MRATRVLRQHNLLLTLFTRDHCSLCVQAKGVLARVWDKRHFEYREVDVTKADQKKWHDLYAFDVPVLHLDKTATLSSHNAETTTGARRLMHRFTEEQLEDAMDAVERL